MEIIPVTEDKKRFLSLLLLADEQEDMIDRYLDRGTLYALADPETTAVCVVTDEGNGVLELKNLAVAPERQGQGYGRAMIRFLRERYQGDYHTLLVGTGDVPSTRDFYVHCGFCPSHLRKNFFTRYYDHPIWEDGKQLVDMIVLKMDLGSGEGKPDVSS